MLNNIKKKQQLCPYMFPENYCETVSLSESAEENEVRCHKQLYAKKKMLSGL